MPRAALLSLPPKPRLEALLREMAGLTARLLELTAGKPALPQREGSVPHGQSHVPHGPGLRTGVPPGRYFLPGSTLPVEAEGATSASEILEMLGYHQGLMSDALLELQKIQALSEERERLRRQVSGAGAALWNFAKRLRDVTHLLEAAEDDYGAFRKLPRGAAAAPRAAPGPGHGGAIPIPVADLVAYARRISYTTFAPPDFAQGAPLSVALPPAPQDEQMRASQLYNHTAQTLGLPTPVLAGEPPPEAGSLPGPGGDVGAPAPQAPGGAAAPLEPPPVTDAVPPAGLAAQVPPPPAMPPGWKPGNPITLPPGLKLPPMPPGWKPGDPVPLPPPSAPAAPPAGAPAAPQAVPPALPPPSARAAAPTNVIHVPFVQLDLNPELEEYESDYSESSDEED